MVVKKDSSGFAKVYKLDSAESADKVIGLVHTPSSKSAGDQAATSGNFVSIVTHGVAKAVSGGKIEIGDPVKPARNTGSSSSGAARVAKAAVTDSNIVGRCLTDATNTQGGQVIDMLVDIAG